MLTAIHSDLGMPVTESVALAPMSTYAATKAAADLALGSMAGQGLRCVRLRPFNHTGPGQSEQFVVAAFAQQVARIAAGLQRPSLEVGNIDTRRDFMDVRDVCCSLHRLHRPGGHLRSGHDPQSGVGHGAEDRRYPDRIAESRRRRLSKCASIQPACAKVMWRPHAAMRHLHVRRLAGPRPYRGNGPCKTCLMIGEAVSGPRQRES